MLDAEKIKKRMFKTLLNKRLGEKSAFVNDAFFLKINQIVQDIKEKIPTIKYIGLLMLIFK